MKLIIMLILFFIIAAMIVEFIRYFKKILFLNRINKNDIIKWDDDIPIRYRIEKLRSRLETHHHGFYFSKYDQYWHLTNLADGKGIVFINFETLEEYCNKNIFIAEIRDQKLKQLGI